MDEHYRVILTDRNGDSAEFNLETPLDYVTLRTAIDSWFDHNAWLQIAVFRIGNDRHSWCNVPVKDITLTELAYIARGYGRLRAKSRSEKPTRDEDLFRA